MTVYSIITPAELPWWWPIRKKYKVDLKTVDFNELWYNLDKWLILRDIIKCDKIADILGMSHSAWVLVCDSSRLW